MSPFIYNNGSEIVTFDEQALFWSDIRSYKMQYLTSKQVVSLLRAHGWEKKAQKGVTPSNASCQEKRKGNGSDA